MSETTIGTCPHCGQEMRPFDLMARRASQSEAVQLEGRELVPMEPTPVYGTLSEPTAHKQPTEKVQVAPETFINIAKKNPDAVGVPVYWAEWPSPSAPEEH